MVKKIFNFINKEIDGLHQAAYLLGFFAILSQLLALVRDRLLASSFGASQSLDLYYAAFRIPDFIFITVGSMVSVSVLIPFLISRIKDGQEEGKKFIGNIFTFFFLLIVVISGITFFAVPFLSKILFPNFTPENLDKVIALTRILLLSPIFLGLSNIFGTLTQTYKRFFIYAISPVLYNISIILGIIFLYPRFGLPGLTYGVVIGAFLHFFIQVPFVIECGMFPKLNFKFNFKEIKEVLLVSVPRTFTLGSDSISFIFLISFASLMTSGSIAIFNFSYNLQSISLSIIGVSYSLAAFPILIKYFTSGETKKFIEQAVLSAKHIIFWSIPLATLFIILRAQIVRTILGSGNFNWSNTRLTAAALAIFAASIVFQNLNLLFVRAYYATGNTFKPFIAKFINATTTIILGYTFMIMYQKYPPFKDFLENLLRIKDVPGSIVLALPLGWSIGELLNSIILWINFEKDFKSFSRSLTKTIFEVVIASVAMGFVSYFCLDIFDNIFDINTALGIFAQGFISGIIGITVAVFILILFKNKEIAEVKNALQGKIFKAKVIPPSPLDLLE
ncbi:MAG: lipid II flippase MurJ [Candidatus Paceibacterota bacterium]